MTERHHYRHIIGIFLILSMKTFEKKQEKMRVWKNFVRYLRKNFNSEFEKNAEACYCMGFEDSDYKIRNMKQKGVVQCLQC